MAQDMKMSRTESFAASLRFKLNILGCPYTEDLTEDSVYDLVMTIGEHRLQVLQWLLLQYHPKLADILQPSHNTLGWKSKSKLQRLVTAANILSLCSIDDIPLIRGEGNVAKQMAFINRLLDLVYARTGDNPERMNAMQCSRYIDSLASHESFGSMLENTTSLDLLPKDIKAEVDQLSNEYSRPPDLKELLNQCHNTSQELERQTNALQLAQSDFSVQTKDQHQEVAAMSHLLSSTVRELSQLASGFTHSFETHIGKWCEKKAPELNELGPTFKRVDSLLQRFITMLEQVSKIRQLKGELEKNIKEKSTRSLVEAHLSHESSNIFETCPEVLEEAIHRMEAGFNSMYKPVLTL